MKTKDYQYQGKRGITDLTREYPYGEWGEYCGSIPKSEYEKDPEKYAKNIREGNEKYIQELKEKGTYGEEFTIVLTLVENPIFDNPTILTEKPVSSSTFEIIDLSDESKQKEM